MNKNSYGAAWSRYWSSGVLNSLPQDFPALYEGEIARFWEQQARRLDPDARIVDLCSGNGAVALHMAVWAQRHHLQWEIDAVDAAELDPDALMRPWPQLASAFQRIRFHSNQPVETLKFPPASVDLVTSQYGLEYCEWDAAAAVVARILRPGGRLAMISHAPNTAMLTAMRREEEDYQLLDQLQAVPRLRQWLGSDVDSTWLQQQLEPMGRQLEQYLKQQDSVLLREMLHTVHGLLHASETDRQSYRPALLAWLEQLVAGAQRLRNMLAINEAITAQPEWAQAFVRAGLHLEDEQELMHDGRHAVGRAQVLYKPAA